jgi:hypothetical protein
MPSSRCRRARLFSMRPSRRSDRSSVARPDPWTRSASTGRGQSCGSFQAPPRHGRAASLDRLTKRDRDSLGGSGTGKTRLAIATVAWDRSFRASVEKQSVNISVCEAVLEDGASANVVGVRRAPPLPGTHPRSSTSVGSFTAGCDALPRPSRRSCTHARPSLWRELLNYPRALRRRRYLSAQ